MPGFISDQTSEEVMSERLILHNNRQVKYTSSRLPVELIFAISFKDEYKADFENYLKYGSGRAFMNKRFG